MKKKNKWLPPVICAGIFILILLVYLAALLYPVLSMQLGDWLSVAVILVSACALIGVMVGIILALRQRLNEIKGGEEDAAAKY